MKSITIEEQTFEYKILYYQSSHGSGYWTEFYQGTEVKSRKKYIFWGEIINKTVPKLMFKIWNNIEDSRYTKDDIRKMLLREVSLINRKKRNRKRRNSMRSFTLNGTITARRIKDLIRKIELCKSKTINLYLCSDGGDGDMADIFTDFTHRTNKKITLIGIGTMASACVHVFVEAKGKKIIYPHTIALLHFVTISHESRDLLNKKSIDYIQKEEIKKENEDRLNYYSVIFSLSEKEKSILKNGGDLVINHERLKQCLTKINKYHHSL